MNEIPLSDQLFIRYFAKSSIKIVLSLWLIMLAQAANTSSTWCSMSASPFSFPQFMTVVRRVSTLIIAGALLSLSPSICIYSAPTILSDSIMSSSVSDCFG